MFKALFDIVLHLSYSQNRGFFYDQFFKWNGLCVKKEKVDEDEKANSFCTIITDFRCL
jgi:hypothetical protein